MTTWQAGVDYATSPLDALAIEQGCYFDQEAAERVESFCRDLLRVVDGPLAGQPFELLDWQKFGITRPLYGWKRANGTRRYRVGYIGIPKKNGKTAIMSCLALYHLVADGEAAPIVALCASDRDQAGNIYKDCAIMARGNPKLAANIDLLDSKKRMFYKRKNGEIRTLSKETGSNEGGKFSTIIFDELHAQKTRDQWDCLRYAGANRKQPLVISITTAGYDRTSICWEQYSYAKDVLGGRSKDTAYFAFVSEAEESDDWKDAKTWRKANPSLGPVLDEEEMAQACQEAIHSPAKENSFKRYRLNLWTQQESRFLQMDAWDRCGGEMEINEGEAIWAGLDLASTTDIAAYVEVWERDGLYGVRPFFWVCEKNARDRERKNKQRLDEWVRRGLITQHRGDEIDLRDIKEFIESRAEKYSIQEIAYDPFGAVYLAQELERGGFPMVKFTQGPYMMNAPTRRLEAMVNAGKLRHGGNPVLRWMASNVVAKEMGETIKLDRNASADKIDGIVALAMAAHRCNLQTGDGGSAYDDPNFKPLYV